MLKLTNISKSFDGIQAVKAINAEFKPGRVYALVGPNGAGKTTLLNIISGFIRPDSGKISIDGKDVTARPAYYIARRGIGRLFQGIRVFPKMSAIENLLTARRFQAEENPLQGLLKYRKNKTLQNDFQKRAISQLVKFGLEEKANVHAENLSYGQGKLLSLSRLLLGDFKILLLDEPVAGVTPQIKATIYKLIKELASQGELIIIVEHEMEAVRRVADEVLFMSAGQMIKRGSPDEILSDKAVISEYIGISESIRPKGQSLRSPDNRHSLLETQEITATYYKREILHGISLKIYSDEIVALIGPNGAGKSTLLKVLAGVLPVKTGGVIFKGEDITQLNARARVKCGIGYFAQGGAVFTDLEVDENLAIAALDMPRAEIAENMAKIFDLFPVLRSMKDKRAGLLSGGERQMLALGMVLMKQPKLILWLDEPSAGLSPKLTKEILNKVLEIKDTFRTSILLVEQRVNEALEYSQRVYLMKEGMIVKESKSEEFWRGKIELEKIYLGNNN